VALPRHKGAFKIIFSIRDLIMRVPNSNIYTVFVSIGCITFMVLMNEVVKPWASKKCKLPIPSELIAVVGFTAISYALGLGSADYNVIEVGKIPTGLPSFEAPPFELLSVVAIDSIAVCIVSYSIVISMAIIFAKKDCYEVRPNQELLAVGLANLVGSCFSCIPLSVSLSRSVIQHQTGGKTQLASVVSATLILIRE
jgi:solute carrier family 26 protein